MSKTTDILSSTAMTASRGATGHRAIVDGASPPITLVLYEFEACPYCRKVREALSALDLEVMIMPCPRGSRNRELVIAQGGKAQFPFLVDRNTQKAMYESDEIIAYLSERYGQGKLPWQHELGGVEKASAHITAGLRPDRGLEARGKKLPEMPLELWSYEASPYCRLVREVLCELELPYLLHNVARQSPRRESFVAISGKMQVPYLKDPNTGTTLFESADIIAYLEKTYGETSV
jgi:glutathione S-transferase